MLISDNKVVVPYGIPYEYVSGGACRGAEAGDFCNDFDLFFTDKSKYIKTMSTFNESFIAKCKEMKTLSFVGHDCIYSCWKIENVNYDCFLFDLTEYELKSFITRTSDFTVNACYQKSGEMLHFQNRTGKHFIDKRLVINNFDVDLWRVITKAKQLVKNGWTVDESTINWMIEQTSEIFNHIDLFQKSKYVKCVSSAYGDDFTIRKVKILSDVFYFANEENITLYFLSDCDFILEYAKCFINKEKSWFRRIVRKFNV